MSFERVLINQAGPLTVPAKLKNVLRGEINKGCSSNIATQPVSLEPHFNPIWTAINRQGRYDLPEYNIEEPIKNKDLVRKQIWISPEQEFEWNNSELFLKQLQTTLFRLGFEVIGNSENIIRAAKFAREKQILVVGISAFDGGELLKLSDCSIHVCTDKGEYGISEDVHMMIDHVLTSFIKLNYG